MEGITQYSLLKKSKGFKYVRPETGHDKSCTVSIKDNKKLKGKYFKY